MAIITRKMIENGLKQGLINPSNDECLICEIGDYWFYFGGSEFEHEAPEHIPFDTLVDEIKFCLDGFYEDDWDTYEDEYMYYYYYLIENLH